MLPTPVDDLGEHLAATLNATSAALVAGAVAETAVLSASGGDHAMRVFVQERFASKTYGDAAYYAGYALPALAAPSIWIAGVAFDDPDTAGAGAAALQALATELAVTTFVKVATGRPYPLNGGDPNAPDRLEHPEYAQTWKPFSLTNRFSWPSGHTSATWSIVAALTAYYPGKWAVPLVGYPIALAIGGGMLAGDRHWTSDVLAGALLAQAIGYPIGLSWRKRRNGERETFTVTPMTGATGIAVGGNF